MLFSHWIKDGRSYPSPLNYCLFPLGKGIENKEMLLGIPLQARVKQLAPTTTSPANENIYARVEL